MGNHPVDQSRYQRSILFSRTLIIGFIGGILASAFLSVSYYFSFVETSPKSFILKPFIEAGWVDRLPGHLLAILISGILSLLPAIIYLILFRKINSIWPGVLFGVILWIIVSFVLQPLFPTVKPIVEQSSDTWVTTFCAFVLYGLFIGYSISFDFHELKREISANG